MTPLMSRYLWFRHAAQAASSWLTSQQAVKLFVPPGQVNTTSVIHPNPLQVLPRLRSLLCFVFVAPLLFFLIFVQFNLRFFFYRKLIICCAFSFVGVSEREKRQVEYTPFGVCCCCSCCCCCCEVHTSNVRHLVSDQLLFIEAYICFLFIFFYFVCVLLLLMFCLRPLQTAIKYNYSGPTKSRASRDCCQGSFCSRRAQKFASLGQLPHKYEKYAWNGIYGNCAVQIPQLFIVQFE